MSSAAMRAADWIDGFLFVGNHPALDFLNTRPIQDGESVELLADFEALLRWLQAAGLLGNGEAASLRKGWEGSARAWRTVEGLRVLREQLREEVLNWERGGSISRVMIDRLNQLLAGHPMRTRLVARRKKYSTELWFDPDRPEDLFAALAHFIALLLAEVPKDRVRKCEHCVLHFQDTSKKGTRRWCSMRLCGNRFKVAAYAARQRSMR